MALLGSDGQCVFTHSFHGVECAREVWAAWRALFFFLIQKEPATEQVGETFSLFFNADIRTSFSADVLKKCALLALHIIAEEERDGDGFEVRVLGDEWKMGCPESPTWESEGEAWSEDEDASSGSSREGNVCNDSLHVVGLHGPRDKISLYPAGVGVGNGGTKLSHGPGHAVPGNA